MLKINKKLSAHELIDLATLIGVVGAIGVQYEIVEKQPPKGNCWDNAVMESFFSRLKVELIYAENYTVVEDARAGILEYIELFYNQSRRHSAIDYVSPNEF